MRPAAVALAAALALAGGLLAGAGMRASPGPPQPAAAEPGAAQPAAAEPGAAQPAAAQPPAGGGALAGPLAPSPSGAALADGPTPSQGGASVAGLPMRSRRMGSVAGRGPVALPRSVPTRLDVAAIGVHTGLVGLGLKADGTIEVPPLGRGAPAGWYRNAPTPGEPGAAVLVGHVDSARDGAAVFYRLGALKPGDDIMVTRADGTVVHFAVTHVAAYPKNAFPTAQVYGPVADSELRLITCGGSFDRHRGSYRDNVIVWAARAPRIR